MAKKADLRKKKIEEFEKKVEEKLINLKETRDYIYDKIKSRIFYSNLSDLQSKINNLYKYLINIENNPQSSELELWKEKVKIIIDSDNIFNIYQPTKEYSSYDVEYLLDLYKKIFSTCNEIEKTIIKEDKKIPFFEKNIECNEYSFNIFLEKGIFINEFSIEINMNENILFNNFIDKLEKNLLGENRDDKDIKIFIIAFRTLQKEFPRSLFEKFKTIFGKGAKIIFSFHYDNRNETFTYRECVLYYKNKKYSFNVNLNTEIIKKLFDMFKNDLKIENNKKKLNEKINFKNIKNKKVYENFIQKIDKNKIERNEIERNEIERKKKERNDREKEKKVRNEMEEKRKNDIYI